jgi:hypothetical protein|nr:MAG TPA: hypothetical protein [Caudoviricetes sp.]
MEDKIYVLIVYYYDDNNEFCYSISPDMHNLNIQLQYAYYRYRLANGEVMEHVSGYYLYLTEESLEKYGWYFKEDDY